MTMNRLLSFGYLLIPLVQGSWSLDRSLPESRHHWERTVKRANDSGSSWPYGPFKTEGRDIINNKGDVITWAGVNWPMSGESMIPEGLEWKSAGAILDDLLSIGFNYIRMGYAIQMIDEIYDHNGTDIPIQTALIQALGSENGTKVTNAILKHNPTWTAQTTRFELWSSIAETAFEKGIFISPDVHIHKAQWCCSKNDGNSWFGDIDFSIPNWLRGLSYVATWAQKHPNIVSMSLRNELRDSANRTNLQYNWENLVGNFSRGADAIHTANPNLLILWSGMQFDQDLSALTTHKNLLTAPCYKCTAIRDRYRREPVYFELSEHPWADKLVWELHLYSMSEDLDTDDCSITEAQLYQNGFNALGIDPPSACEKVGGCQKAYRLTPVILSEFGWAQDKTLYTSTLQTCLQSFTRKHGVSWQMWSLAGSYRIRSGKQGFDDTWGLTNGDWTGWRHPDTIENWWKPWAGAMNVTRKGS